MADKSSDIRFLVTVDRPSYGGDYFHVAARTVVFDPADDQVRNVSAGSSCMDTDTDLTYADLVVSAQGEIERSSMPELYAWRCQYGNVYSVDARRAEIMLKTLRKVARGLDKIEGEYGPAETFPAYLVRVAKVLGITRFGFRRGQSSGWHHQNDYTFVDATNVAAWIGTQVQHLREARV